MNPVRWLSIYEGIFFAVNCVLMLTFLIGVRSLWFLERFNRGKKGRGGTGIDIYLRPSQKGSFSGSWILLFSSHCILDTNRMTNIPFAHVASELYLYKFNMI